MNNRSRSKSPSQTRNQKPRQKQLGLIRGQPKMQQKSWQEYHSQYPTKDEQIPATIFDKQQQQQPSQQLLPNHPMLTQQHLGQRVYGHEQTKQYHLSMTPEHVQALNDYYYQQYYMYRQQLEQKNQEYLQSIQQSRNTNNGHFLTSFLHSGNSFLTPWSWKPDQAPHTEENRRLMFQPGSFFSYDMPSSRLKEEECSKREEECSRQAQSSKQP